MAFPLILLGCGGIRRLVRYSIYAVGGGGAMAGSCGGAKGGNGTSGVPVYFDIYRHVGDTITYWIGEGGKGGEHRIAYNVTTHGGAGGNGYPTSVFGDDNGGKGGDGWSGSSGGGSGGGGGGGASGVIFRNSDGSTLGVVGCGGGGGGGGATLNTTEQPVNGGDASWATGGTTDSYRSTGGAGADGSLSGGGGGGQGIQSPTDASVRGGLGGTGGTGWGGVASTGGRRGGWINTIPTEFLLPSTLGPYLNIPGDNLGQRLGEAGWDYYPNYSSWPSRGVDGKAGGLVVRNTESGQQWVIDTAGSWRTFTFQ